MRTPILERSRSDIGTPPVCDFPPAEPSPYQEWESPPPDKGMEPDPLEVPRNERIAWKLAHLDQWRNHIQTLPHYDHDYAYDITHEYGIDWTTDSDYMPEVGRMHFNENDILTPQTNRHRTLQSEALPTLVESQAEHDLTVTAEPAMTFVSFTYPKSMIRPDLAVLPWSSPPPGRDPEDALYNIRINEGDPAPLLVVEITSPGSTRTGDLRGKMQLYAELGIAEYVLIDSPSKNAPYSLRAFGLQGGHAYREAVLQADSEGIPNYHSEALGCPIRLRQPDSPPMESDRIGLKAPRLQWFDSSVARWRDVRTDTEHQLQTAEAKLDQTEAKLDQTEAERDQMADKLDQAETERDQMADKLDQVEAERNQAKSERERAEAEQLEASIGIMRVLLADSKPQAARRVEEFWRRHGAPAGHLVAELVRDVATGDAPLEALLRAVPDDAGKETPDADHLPHEADSGNGP